MNDVAIIVAGVAVLGVLISLVWRLSSHRRSLPCPSWLGWMVELDNPFTKVNRARFIVNHLEVKPGMKILDAGCGPGRLTLPLARAVGPEGHVLALDVQAGMLERVRDKLHEAGLLNVQTLQVELGKAGLPLNEYDRAVLVTVLGETTDQHAVLQEIHDALKPEGILSITEVIFDPHFQRRETVVRAAEAVGFEQRRFLGRRLAYTLHFEKRAGGS